MGTSRCAPFDTAGEARPAARSAVARPCRRWWLPALVLCAACSEGRRGDPLQPPSGPEQGPSPAVSAGEFPADVLLEAERRLAIGDLAGILDLLEEREPGSLPPRAKLLLAVALHKSQRHGAAEPLYAEVLASDAEVGPREGWIHMHAQCLLQLGRLDEARERFERHAELDPEEGDTPLGLGRIALAEGRLEAARAHFERAVELHRAATASGRTDRREQEGRALAWLGDTHLVADDPVAARAALEASVERFPWSRGAWTKLAEVCQVLGDRSGAARALAERDRLDALQAEDRPR